MMGSKTIECDDMKVITCYYTLEQIEFMETIVKKGYFPNRSEFLRYLVAEYHKFLQIKEHYQLEHRVTELEHELKHYKSIKSFM